MSVSSPCTSCFFVLHVFHSVFSLVHESVRHHGLIQWWFWLFSVHTLFTGTLQHPTTSLQWYQLQWYQLQWYLLISEKCLVDISIWETMTAVISYSRQYLCRWEVLLFPSPVFTYFFVLNKFLHKAQRCPSEVTSTQTLGAEEYTQTLWTRSPLNFFCLPSVSSTVPAYGMSFTILTERLRALSNCSAHIKTTVVRVCAMSDRSQAKRNLENNLRLIHTLPVEFRGCFGTCADGRP